MKKHIQLHDLEISFNSRLNQHKLKTIYVILFYFFRFVRQKTNLLYLRSIGRYGFFSIGKNVIIDGIPRFLYPCSHIILKDNVRIGRNCFFQGTSTSKIIIGNNVSINDGCLITSLFKIVIGDNTSIGEYTSIRDYNHSYNKQGNIKMNGYEGNEISIGKNCWIGRGVIILPGVTIEEGAIIAANSVVNKNVKKNTIVGGVPANFIKHRLHDK